MTTPLEADPFYRELRRRHPDIDIVLLPEAPPDAAAAASEAPPLPPEPAAVRQDLGDSFDTWWSVLTGLGMAPPGAVSRWRAGTSDDEIFAERVLRTPAVADGSTLLLDAAAALAARSWDVHVPRGGVPRLMAEHAGRTLTLSMWDGAATLTLRSEPYAVDAATRRALLREPAA